MKYYAGLDVSVKETSVCIVDERGTIIRERGTVSHPADLVALLSDPRLHLERVGLEAGPLSQWLYEGDGQGWAASDLHRDTSHQGASQGPHAEQERSQ